MTKLEIKDLFSPDVDPDEWIPTDNSVFALLQLEIGMEGDERKDTFDIVVATPEGLLTAPQDKLGAVSRRALLVVREFSWPKVRAILSDIVERCQSDDWDACVLRLQRYFEWEYEDFIQEKPRRLWKTKSSKRAGR